jgi:hypothetical protein
MLNFGKLEEGRERVREKRCMQGLMEMIKALSAFVARNSPHVYEKCD